MLLQFKSTVFFLNIYLLNYSESFFYYFPFFNKYDSKAEFSSAITLVFSIAWILQKESWFPNIFGKQ